ncbi:hypothetical protein AB0N87_44000 [Streptomyces sp. NPDC093228]|uniref:hypothetical protein n=1 Tax=Streptomyces sp. NPDC093228 TaxID=3155070 RepID=UPI003434C4D4
MQQLYVADDIFDSAGEFLSERELVEVLQVIGCYWTFARISTVLNVEVTKIYDDESILNSPGDATSD